MNPTDVPKPFDLKAELANLPDKPGVYRMYDAAGNLIYIGKAKVLKNRVRSYFQKSASHAPKVTAMVAQIERFNTIVTTTEVEALILEDTLIKTHQPRYNIALRDGKHYPWLAITDEPYPRLIITRRNKGYGKRAKYFGPFVNSNSLYDILKLLRKNFPMRQRRKPLFRDRPCMNFSIKLCPGPCQQRISAEAYLETVHQVEMFLKGHTDQLRKDLTRQMGVASESMAFEQAGQLRDRIRAIETLSERQRVVSDDATLSLDAVAIAEDGWIALLIVLSVREGRVIASKPFEVAMGDHITIEDIYDGFIRQYYRDVADADLPDELLIQKPVEDADVLSDWLSGRHKRKVTVHQPQRGPRKELAVMALNNARQALEQARLYEATKLKNDPVRALLDLQEILGLPNYPERMECYDISHFQGSQTVASMVVFTDGVADSAAYRRFKIQIAEGKPDDFASMHEVISRRLQHLTDWGEPDLIIIDGGKGQLSSAVEAMRAAGMNDMPIISLAKRYEEVYLPERSDPVVIRHDSPSLFVLQQIRDEAHRFAITYHRTLRDKKTIKSPLDDVPGLGPKRKEQLLQHYKSANLVAKASVQDLMQVLKISPKQAMALHGAIAGVMNAPDALSENLTLTLEP